LGEALLICVLSWKIPTLVVWGATDKYLSTSEAERFSEKNADVISVRILEGAGHMPQEDWYTLPFLRLELF
jgi:pimeloyl-ACP methyl ester carboxylesterase